MFGLTTDLTSAIAERKQHETFRQLKDVAPINSAEIFFGGQRFLNFSSNDYLGLSQHPFLKARAIEFISHYGIGSGASRLVSGNNEAYQRIENRLAELKGTESALIFSAGYQLNLTVLLALSKLVDTFICDRHCHNSILMGASLSKKQFIRFAHNDLTDLCNRLNKRASAVKSGLIITESVFGMDGDLSNLKDLVDISKSNGCQLFIDEAHATGVFGNNGMGLACQNENISLIMGTFGKGCGSFGAYIACTNALRDYLINFCPGFIYTTALPPPVLGAIDAALEIIPSMTKERHYLLTLAEYMRDGIKSLGFNIGRSESQIVPIIVGDDSQAVALAQHLESNQIFAPAIRTPTVLTGTARVRLSISALHTEAHIDKLIQVLKQWRTSGK